MAFSHILTSTGVTNILSWTNILIFYFFLRAFDAWFQKRQCMPHSENTNFPHQRSLWSPVRHKYSLLSYPYTSPKHSIALIVNSGSKLMLLTWLNKSSVQTTIPQNLVQKMTRNPGFRPFGGSHFTPLVIAQNTYSHNQNNWFYPFYYTYIITLPWFKSFNKIFLKHCW